MLDAHFPRNSLHLDSVVFKVRDSVIEMERGLLRKNGQVTTFNWPDADTSEQFRLIEKMLKVVFGVGEVGSQADGSIKYAVDAGHLDIQRFRNIFRLINDSRYIGGGV